VASLAAASAGWRAAPRRAELRCLRPRELPRPARAAAAGGTTGSRRVYRC